jgi:hypothetical protein
VERSEHRAPRAEAHGNGEPAQCMSTQGRFPAFELSSDGV